MLIYHSHSDGTDKMRTLNARTYKTFHKSSHVSDHFLCLLIQGQCIKMLSNIAIASTVTQRIVNQILPIYVAVRELMFRCALVEPCL